MGIYLLMGPEEGEKEEERKRIRNEILSKHEGAEETSFYTSDDKDDLIISSLRQPSLFADHRIITIKYFENATETLKKRLSEYALSPDPDLDLIILSSGTQNPFSKKAEAAIEKKIFWEEFDRDKRLWIRNRFQKNGKRVTDDAIDEILSSLENNKAEMGNAIDMISSYYMDRKEISGNDISSVLSREKGENGYTLFGKIAKKDLEEALLAVGAIDLRDSRGLIGANAILLNQFRLLEDLRLKIEEGNSEKEAFKLAEGLSVTYPVKGIRFPAQDSFRSALRNYTKEDVSNIILLLEKNDNVIKTSQDMKTVMEEIVWRIIKKGGRETSLTLYPDSLEVELM